jgi:type II secretory pathway predicted ATPase ExeA
MAEVKYAAATRVYAKGTPPAVDALDLEVKDGEFMVLVGPSGSGKTTALRMAILRSFGPAVDLLADGAVDPRPLLGEPLPLEQFGEAVNRVRAGQGIKWHIRP